MGYKLNKKLVMSKIPTSTLVAVNGSQMLVVLLRSQQEVSILGTFNCKRNPVAQANIE